MFLGVGIAVDTGGVAGSVTAWVVGVTTGRPVVRDGAEGLGVDAGRRGLGELVGRVAGDGVARGAGAASGRAVPLRVSAGVGVGSAAEGVEARVGSGVGAAAADADDVGAADGRPVSRENATTAETATVATTTAATVRWRGLMRMWRSCGGGASGGRGAVQVQRRPGRDVTTPAGG